MIISIWKSQVGKGMFFIIIEIWKLYIYIFCFINIGTEYRRPTTADSAKTSNLDSDDNLNEEESN